MSTGKYVRAIAIGEYFAGSFLGEIFQTGISMTNSDSGGDFPGAIKQVPSGFTAAAAAETESTALFNIDYAWEGASKFTLADQLLIATEMHTFMSALRSLMYTNQRWTEIRLQAFQADGKVINGASVFKYITPLVGTAASGVIPPVLTPALSLRTGARGPSGRGRMFLPTPACQATGGTIVTTAQNAILAGAKALVEGLWEEAGAVPCVYSQTHGYYSGISKLQVGNIWDVQRRRDNAINETYAEQTPVYAP